MPPRAHSTLPCRSRKVSVAPPIPSVALDSALLARFMPMHLLLDAQGKVISTGPYDVVRHPMYLGLILMVLFTPLALG